jgi:hypothetical protein
LNRAVALKPFCSRAARSRTIAIASGIDESLTRAVVDDFRRRFVPQGKIAWIVGTSEVAVAVGDSAEAKQAVAAIGPAELPGVGIEDIGAGRLILVDCAPGQKRNFASCLAALARIFCLPETALVFVNAYRTRSDLATCTSPPWKTAAWFADEPGHYIEFNGGQFFSRR